MNTRWSAAVAGLLVSAAWAVADVPPPPGMTPWTPILGGATVAPPVPLAGDSVPPAPPPPGSGCEHGPRYWATADYLFWWVKQAPLPLPLVTTGGLTDPLPAVVGEPGTQVLLGNQNIDYSGRSGVRATVGGWLDRERLVGWEGGGFYLGQATRTYAFVGSPNGTPILVHPFRDITTDLETVYPFSAPAELVGTPLVGQSMVRLETRLGGYELNLTVNLRELRRVRWFGFVGFRGLIHQESLTITDTFTAGQPGSGLALFRGEVIDPPSGLVISDSFVVQNRFYGGQIGWQGEWSEGPLTLGLLGKLAVGATDQIARVDGETRVTGPAGPRSAAGGTYAQATNSGRHARTVATAVSEAGLQVGYAPTDWLTVRLGYTFLYWSNVARPGQLLDRRINPNQVPSDFRFGTPGGPPNPDFAFRTADFWAQGLCVGLDVRF